MEATPGFEPGIEALQAPALPLGDVAVIKSLFTPKMVRMVRIEPTLHYWNRILSPARLPIPPHSQNKKQMERATRFELATSTLARMHSTTELCPHQFGVFYIGMEL